LKVIAGIPRHQSSQQKKLHDEELVAHRLFAMAPIWVGLSLNLPRQDFLAESSPFLASAQITKIRAGNKHASSLSDDMVVGRRIVRVLARDFPHMQVHDAE